ncbi:MAG: hypothetical protein ACI978_001474 [Oleispira sp.]|jgi:hypothetical protein
MRSLSFILLITSSACFAQMATPTGLDPDLIDPEMADVMYRIAPSDLKTISYQNGSPSVFNIKLCQACQIKPYRLEKGAEILLNDQTLALKDLTVALIKKKFNSIQLGINRSTKTVTYLFLGGTGELSASELRAEELTLEQSDES